MAITGVRRTRARFALRSGTVVAIAVAIAIAVWIIARPSTRAPAGPAGPTGPSACIYTRTGIDGLNQAAKLLGVAPRCAVIFDRAAPNWSAWERPWFIGNPIKSDDWDTWATRPGRRLIVTLGLIPNSAESEDWRALGAAGHYAGYARALAHNLVAARLGSAIIRLSNEPNGTWFVDNIGSTSTARRQWVALWQRTAAAMLSVPGAHFKFDWTVANGTGSVPLGAFYPGDKLVSYIGDDIYDTGHPVNGTSNWNHLATEPGGVDDVLAFARAHHKQFSIPEWGLEPSSSGAGGDAAFVKAIADLTHRDGFAYQGYFFAGASASVLQSDATSLAAYRSEFDHES